MFDGHAALSVFVCRLQVCESDAHNYTTLMRGSEHTHGCGTHVSGRAVQKKVLFFDTWFLSHAPSYTKLFGAFSLRRAMPRKSKHLNIEFGGVMSSSRQFKTRCQKTIPFFGWWCRRSLVIFGDSALRVTSRRRGDPRRLRSKIAYNHEISEYYWQEHTFENVRQYVRTGVGGFKA